MICPYCQGEAVLVTGAEVYYGSRDPGLRSQPFWKCAPCGAWVGCHPGTTQALGQLANQATRKARAKAHELFDALWKRKMERDKVSKSVARDAAYAWLAKELGIARVQCHIGHMQEDTALRVVALCLALKKPKQGELQL